MPSARSSRGTGPSSTRSAVELVESAEPLAAGRVRARPNPRTAGRLGDPQRAYRSIHVVGTNGKGDDDEDDRGDAAARGAAGGRYFSPHVTGWAERIRVGGTEADFERAVERVRPAAERSGDAVRSADRRGAGEFAERGVDVAAVEAGLGGRYDATNVLVRLLWS